MTEKPHTTFEQFKQVCEIVRHNEDVSRKFYDIEVFMLGVLNFRQFFLELPRHVEEILDVPIVRFAVVANSKLHELMRLVDCSPDECERVVVIHTEDLQCILGRQCDKPVLISNAAERHSLLLGRAAADFAGSLAIAPLYLDGALCGAFVQADDDAERFVPDKDTTLLNQLAVKMSLCISNVSAHERLEMLAGFDPLTGLANRRKLEDRLRDEFARSQRYGAPLAVAFLDVNDFKSVNDRFGHDVGDAALKHLAEGLKRVTRQNDLPARFAGDEFVVVFSSSSRESAERCMERLQEYLNETPLFAGVVEVPVDVSWGTASADERDAASPAALLKKADARLYEDKKRRKAAKLHDSTRL